MLNPGWLPSESRRGSAISTMDVFSQYNISAGPILPTFSTDSNSDRKYPSLRSKQEDAKNRPDDPLEAYSLKEYYENHALMRLEGCSDATYHFDQKKNGDNGEKETECVKAKRANAERESALHKKLRCADTLPVEVAQNIATRDLRKILSNKDPKQRLIKVTPAELPEGKLPDEKKDELLDAISEVAKSNVSPNTHCTKRTVLTSPVRNRSLVFGHSLRSVPEG
jgi:hypothetical protein